MEKGDLLELVKKEEVNFVRLVFTDILGIPKNVEIPVGKLATVLQHGAYFDGSSIEGFVRISESDMYLRPDLDTFVIYPWNRHLFSSAKEVKTLESDLTTAGIVCDVYTPDGNPFPGDPRHILKSAVADAKQMGYTAYAGPEPEFFLLQKDDEGRPTLNLHDQGGYFDLMPVDLGEEARKDIVIALEKMGFEVEAAHHEVAAGQHEIDFKYEDVLKTADNIITFKMVTKTISLAKGLHATFMPKPIAGENGSGMHTHISLFQDGKNAFYDRENQYGLSKVALHFIGGLIHHTDAITALTNPTINSYKRLVPGYEAPVNISWARINRSCLIRVPGSKTPEESTRIEFRSPDPSANPYLAFAGILASGLDGIKREIEPPQPVEEDIYTMPEAERESRDIKTLPRNLHESLKALENDKVVKDAIGKHILEKFMDAKTRELQEYSIQVTDWEINRYLEYY